MCARSKATAERPAAPVRIGLNTPVGAPWGIPMGLETILYDHFGLRSMLRVHDASTLAEWRKCMGTYFDAMGRAIRDTVKGDARYKAELLSSCRHSAERVRRAKSHGELLTSSVTCLARLSFDLLGGAAEQSGERTGSRRNYGLARHRTMSYTRDAEQMVALVLDCALFWNDKFVEEVPDFVALVKVRMESCKGDDDAFMDWFRREFPKSYDGRGVGRNT